MPTSAPVPRPVCGASVVNGVVEAEAEEDRVVDAEEDNDAEAADDEAREVAAARTEDGTAANA